jgi:uncharacterized membrane protein
MPARGRVFAAMVALALIGLGIATYLTVVHYEGGSPVCAISHGCETVQHSRYSKLAGIPVAVIGLVGYVAILVTLAIRHAEAALATVAVTFLGLCFSLYLTYREIFTIKAICQWCVGSAVVMALLTVLAVVRYLRPHGPANTLPA